ncbi:hypothetical protein [Kamptonema sp. UHCC 0994]|uniref:hypothetical protein n=1 Tax=Kamptonema sp. UHCC 0994 TaxID=3031329 RepID=UPI0023B9D1D4|nr:hypothetical protein [Kamptonema sp. UHCC 0994]MDF0553132.1 hypothetical protein [Kamptonema sp. UHCC 0994]
MTSLIPSDFKWCGSVESFLSRVLLRHSLTDYALSTFPYKNFLILIFEVLVPTKCLKEGLYAEISVASPYESRKTFIPSGMYYKKGTNYAEVVESLKREIDKSTEITWRYQQPSIQIY